MKRASVCIALLLVGLGSLPASADRARFADPRDSAGPQDVRALISGHGGAKDDRVTQSIVTHGRWRTRRMRCPKGEKCRSGFQIYITTDRDRDYERAIYVYRIEGRLQATMQAFRWDSDCGSVRDPVCDDGSHSLGEIRVWRPDRRTVKTSFSLRKLGRRDPAWFGWRVMAAYRREEPCPRYSTYDQTRMEYTCIDYVPERDYWGHQLD